MILPAWLIGAFMGLFIGGVTHLILGRVIDAQSKEGRIDRGSPFHVLDLVRKLDLFTMPVVCGLIGHFVFGGSQ